MAFQACLRDCNAAMKDPQQATIPFNLKPQNTMKPIHLPRAAMLLTLAAISPLAAAEETPKEKSKTEMSPAVMLPGSLTTVIADSATFSILTAVLKASGLDVTLGSKGEYTIFAPTDEAFGKLPAGTLDKLLLPENKEKLRMLLLYHVVAGNVPSNKVTTGEVKTVNGEKIMLQVSGDKVEVNGGRVFSVDVAATNGVMHTLGTVLVPKSLVGFAGLKD